jgi:carboxyl-terminal processing protease
MKDNYNKGFLTGMLVTLGIVLGAVLVYFVFFHDVLKNSSNTGNQSSVSATGDEDYDTFINTENAIMKIVNEKFYKEVDAETMYRGAYSGILASLEDPYACYYSKEEYQAMTETTNGEYVGIGCYVAVQKDSNDITVVSVIKGSPAEKAGMLANDILVKVEDTEVNGTNMDYALSLIKGPVGTKVAVTVKRDNDLIELSMTRDKIEVQLTYYEMIDGNIGYIYVASFYKPVPEQFKEALKDLESQGMEKLIVDLRDDPGGLYDVAVEMVDIFLDRDLEVAYVEDNTGKKQWSYTNDLDTFDKPVVILINGNSASASELFTQTLREYNKVTVIGTKSYGKGVYQNLYPLSVNGAVIKITGGRYFSPKGVCVDGAGIEPDITVEYVKIDSSITDPELTDDNQIKAAEDFLNKN